jgi:hypothetical protein
MIRSLVEGFDCGHGLLFSLLVFCDDSLSSFFTDVHVDDALMSNF